MKVPNTYDACQCCGASFAGLNAYLASRCTFCRHNCFYADGRYEHHDNPSTPSREGGGRRITLGRRPASKAAAGTHPAEANEPGPGERGGMAPGPG